MHEQSSLPTCTFPGCEKPRRTPGSALCKMHYHRQYRGVQMDGPPRKPEPNRTGRCAVNGCEKPPTGRYCEMHRARIQRHGNTDWIGPVRRRGPAHHKWLENPRYHTVHDRLNRWRGPASGCEQCGDTDPSAEYQWALDWEKAGGAVLMDDAAGCAFSADVAHYISLCVPCHKRMDLARLGKARV